MTRDRFTPDSDLIAENMLSWARMARQMPLSFEMGGVSYNVDSPSGGPGSVGKLLPGRGFMPSVDLKTLGITKDIPGVYDPSRYRRTADEVRAGWRRRGLLVEDDGDIVVKDSWNRDHHLIRWGTVSAYGKPSFLREPEKYPYSVAAAISTYDGIIASRGAGKANDAAFTKVSITTTGGVWYSLWHAGGQPPAGTYLATTPPTDANLDRTNAAAISQYLTSPTSPDKKYLLTFGFGSASQINMAVLVDIINHSGLYKMSVNTAETVTTPTITSQRQYGTGSGVGNLVTAIVQTAGTPGAGTWTLQTVDQAGANTNAPAITTAAVAVILDAIFTSSVGVTTGGGSFFVPLASGQTGVQAVKQSTFSVAGTGNLACNVFFPLSFVPGIAAGAYIERDSTTQIDGITELVTVSSVIGHLALYVLTNSTTSGSLTGFLRTVAG